MYILVHLNGRQRVLRQGFKTKYQNPWSLIIVAIVVTLVLTLTYFDAFLFISRHAMHTLLWRHCMLFCLLITWFYTVKKNKWKVRDWKVRNNRFCQYIEVWSNFQLHWSKILPFIKENDTNVLQCQQPSFIFHLVT